MIMNLLISYLFYMLDEALSIANIISFVFSFIFEGCDFFLSWLPQLELKSMVYFFQNMQKKIFWNNPTLMKDFYS